MAALVTSRRGGFVSNAAFRRDLDGGPRAGRLRHDRNRGHADPDLGTNYLGALDRQPAAGSHVHAFTDAVRQGRLA